MNTEKKHICVIGAAIMDLMGFPQDVLKAEDSVPGELVVAAGGVGRNIAENLARLNLDTKLITAFGDDYFSKALIKGAEEAKIDISHSLFKKGKAATHLALMNEKNDMSFGLASLDIVQKIDTSSLKKRKKILETAEIIITDANIPIESLQWLSAQNEFKQVFIDLVSSHFAEKIKPFIGQFHSLKANRLEAEILTEININIPEDYAKAAHILLKKGVKQVFITAGGLGAFYCKKETEGWIDPLSAKVQNTTGAGDAFMAGIAYASMQNLSIKECTQMGVAAASIAVESRAVVNEQMSKKLLKLKINGKLS